MRGASNQLFSHDYFRKRAPDSDLKPEQSPLLVNVSLGRRRRRGKKHVELRQDGQAGMQAEAGTSKSKGEDTFTVVLLPTYATYTHTHSSNGLR